MMIRNAINHGIPFFLEKINHGIPVSVIYDDPRDYFFSLFNIWNKKNKNSVMAFGRKRVRDFMCMCWLLFFFLLAYFYLFRVLYL